MIRSGVKMKYFNRSIGDFFVFKSRTDFLEYNKKNNFRNDFLLNMIYVYSTSIFYDLRIYQSLIDNDYLTVKNGISIENYLSSYYNILFKNLHYYRALNLTSYFIYSSQRDIKRANFYTFILSNLRRLSYRDLKFVIYESKELINEQNFNFGIKYGDNLFLFFSLEGYRHEDSNLGKSHLRNMHMIIVKQFINSIRGINNDNSLYNPKYYANDKYLFSSTLSKLISVDIFNKYVENLFAHTKACISYLIEKENYIKNMFKETLKGNFSEDLYRFIKNIMNRIEAEFGYAYISRMSLKHVTYLENGNLIYFSALIDTTITYNAVYILVEFCIDKAKNQVFFYKISLDRNVYRYGEDYVFDPLKIYE